MAEYTCPMALVCPGGTITFNATSGDAFVLDPAQCAGADEPVARTTVEDKARTDGAWVFDTLDGRWAITLSGLIIPADGTPATRNSMEATMRAAVRSAKTGDATLQQTPSGAALRQLTGLRKETFSVSGGYLKTFVITLVGDGSIDWA